MRIEKKSRINVQTVTSNIELCSRNQNKISYSSLNSIVEWRQSERNHIYLYDDGMCQHFPCSALTLTHSLAPFIRWALDSYIRHTLYLRRATYHYICIMSFKHTHKRSRTDTHTANTRQSIVCFLVFAYCGCVASISCTHICINGFTILLLAIFCHGVEAEAMWCERKNDAKNIII